MYTTKVNTNSSTISKQFDHGWDIATRILGLGMKNVWNGLDDYNLKNFFTFAYEHVKIKIKAWEKAQ